MKVVAIKIPSKMTKATATTTTPKIKTSIKAATEAMIEKGVVVMIEGIVIMIEVVVVVVVAEMIEEEDVEAVVMIEVVADLPIVKLLID